MISQPGMRFLLSALILLPLLGCEEEITMVGGSERPFSLYGVLNPQMDTQWVHVFPIEGSLQQGDDQALDVRFTSKDQTGGEIRVWSDSLLRDAQGVYGHVFWSPFRVEYEHTYHLEAIRSDGSASLVTVAVPPEITPLVGEATGGGEVILPIYLKGSAPRLLRVILTISARTKWVPLLGGSPGSYLYKSLRKSFSVHGERFWTSSRADDGWIIGINLSKSFQPMRDTLAIYVGPQIDYNGVELQLLELNLIAANAEWDPPGNVFDSLLMVQPGIMTNVENGFGFVGAGFRVRHQWKPDPEVVVRAGYVLPLASSIIVGDE